MARKKDNRPKRKRVILDEAHGAGHVERVSPEVLEREHAEHTPDWARKTDRRDNDVDDAEGVLAA